MIDIYLALDQSVFSAHWCALCGLFKMPGFSSRRYFKRLIPTPFLDHGSAAKSLIAHRDNTASYAG